MLIVVFINVDVVLQRYQITDDEDHVLLFDLIQKMLDYDPAERITLSQVY